MSRVFLIYNHISYYYRKGRKLVIYFLNILADYVEGTFLSNDNIADAGGLLVC